jgi:hypothetical protein
MENNTENQLSKLTSEAAKCLKSHNFYRAIDLYKHLLVEYDMKAEYFVGRR